MDCGTEVEYSPGDIEQLLRDREPVDLTLPRFVSYGGGRNSTAVLVVLLAEGIKPDAILFADTGGEKPETYQYLDIVDGWLVEVGFPEITRLKANSKHKDLESECLTSSTFPSKTYGYGKCSSKWKIQPQDKFRNKFKRDRGLTKHIEYQGIHYEKHRLIGRNGRLKNIEDEKMRIEYPLIDKRMGDIECIQLIMGAGLPVPPKSACFFCPSSKPSEVLLLREQHPELYDRAVQIEKSGMSTAKSSSIKGLGRSFSWQDIGKLTPLEKLVIENRLESKKCSCID